MHEDFKILKTNRSGVDADLRFDALADDAGILEPLLNGIDAVINCISNGDVDSCEKDPEHSRRINFDFVEDLCALQKKHGFQLVHFSSNAIYDGENAPYSETSPAHAVNRYGEIKIEADKYIEDNLDNYTILRPITMYGVRLGKQRHNPYSFFYQQLIDNKDIVAVDDVYVNMLHVEDLVRCVKTVIDRQINGTFNISGDEVVNRYEFVSMIKALIPGSQSKIKRVTSDQFETAAERPRDTSFDNSAMKNVLGITPGNLKETLQSLVEHSQSEQYADTPLRKIA